MKTGCRRYDAADDTVESEAIDMIEFAVVVLAQVAKRDPKSFVAEAVKRIGKDPARAMGIIMLVAKMLNSEETATVFAHCAMGDERSEPNWNDKAIS